ncbi:Rhomboid family [Musa troglodytarum]|nr:Rhomboid family [Musa troglodytarum]
MSCLDLAGVCCPLCLLHQASLFGLLGGMLSELLTNWTIYANKFAALSTLIFIIVINLAVGLLPDVDNFAHIGGFVSSWIYASNSTPARLFLQSSQEGSNVTSSCEGSSRTHSYFLPDATEAQLQELCSQLCG